MTHTQTEYVAHVITSVAISMGNPQIIIMASGAGPYSIVETISLEEGKEGPKEVKETLADIGWEVVGNPKGMDVGYWLYQIESCVPTAHRMTTIRTCTEEGHVMHTLDGLDTGFDCLGRLRKGAGAGIGIRMLTPTSARCVCGATITRSIEGIWSHPCGDL